MESIEYETEELPEPDTEDGVDEHDRIEGEEAPHLAAYEQEAATTEAEFQVKFNHIGILYSPDRTRRFRSGVWYTMSADEYNEIVRVSSRHIADKREL